ncbi:MAG: zinc-dependent peptidase [Xanthomonadales bacterium]|nr:zinc-dependent peptidase [Xanthomonadales bacterium]
MIWPFRRRTAAPDLDPVLWRQAAAGLPWLRNIDDARAAKLQALVAGFLAGKSMTPLHGLRLNDVQRMRLAMLCCLPLLEFGREGLHGWRELLVYPDAFRVQRSHQDAHGVLHEWDDELIGEAWEHGPVILSWADVRADIAAPRDGFCVVAHEIAHKLDALDGAMDGTPPLPRDWQKQWASDFQRAYDALCEEVDAGRESAIDDYAAESPEEFFAVCTEYHFSDPRRLRDAMPEVAAHLQRFYGMPLLA